MPQIAPSGYYYPNMIVHYMLEAMEEIMGKNGLNAILNMAGLMTYKKKFFKYSFN